MLTLKKVAVTGGLASGKTSVCRILESCGAYVISADAIVHQLLSPHTKVGQQVVSLLGSTVSNEQGFDRKEIARLVFSDPEKLRALEKILHPTVFEEIEKQYYQVKDQTQYSLFVAEIPLLYESEKGRAFFDVVIAVISDPELCCNRYGSRQDYGLRMNAQYSQEQKAALADFVVINNGKKEELKQNVINLFLKELHPQ